MGLLDVLLGRSRPRQPNLDRLFALPSAAITLQTSSRFRPTGVGSVCVRPAEGAAFTGLEREIDQILVLDGGRYEKLTDRFGFRWLVRRTSADDMPGLVTDLHAINSTLRDAGFGPALLCAVVAFFEGSRSDGSRSFGLVYLFIRGTWYPFAPLADERRDNPLELQMKATLEGDLPIEPDLSRWFPVWGAPGLDEPAAPR
ncbi:PspA-associated protein PspAB [Protofrankia symbiont of Coriaria ruscifolia]|uniref:PspA-associated protein PspAB n=1 Tax=Protofrankia symbiont of Coriaria ruscifolia TaxID=1306542 RepID=UPI0010413082|nr:hypothetical protein [Protofrankia symbiont of Coriaria ruscifolia]